MCSPRFTSCWRSCSRERRVTGVRIDHPDGLFDPARYFEWLQDLAADAWGISRTPDERPLYVVVEKILSGGEQLPSGWAVHGTTGYNFLNQVNGLFVDSEQRATDAARLHETDRTDRELRGSAVRQQAGDHGHVDGERTERARRHAEPDQREQSQLARLHAQQPSRRDRRSRRVLSRSTAPTSPRAAGRRKTER